MNKATDVFEALKSEIAGFDGAREYAVTGEFEKLFDVARTGGMELSVLCDPEDSHFVWEITDGNMACAFCYFLVPAGESGQLCAHEVQLTLTDCGEDVESIDRKFKGAVVEWVS